MTAFTLKQVNHGRRKQLILPNIAIFLTLVFLETVLHVQFPAVLLLLIYVLPVFYGSDDDILTLIACCMPLYIAFQYKYALLILCFVLLFRCRFNLKHPQAAVIVVLMMFWELLHGFYEPFSGIEYLRGFSELITVAVVVGCPDRDYDYELILRRAILTTLCICIILTFSQIQRAGFSLARFLDNAARFGNNNTDFTNFGLNYNPNGLGHICNMALGVMSIFFVEGKLKKGDLPVAILLTLFGVMTMSRTFFICAALNIVLLLLFLSRNNGYGVRKTVLLVLIAVLALAVINWIAPTFVKQFLRRFGEKDIFNGRLDILTFYHKHLMSSLRYLVFGVGLQGYSGKINELYGTSVDVCHNSVQELVVTWGVVGLILFVIFILCIAEKPNIRHHMISYLPLTLVLFFSMAGQLVSSGSTLLCLLFACICIRTDLSCATTGDETGDYQKLSEKPV